MHRFKLLICLFLYPHLLFAGGEYNFDKLADAQIAVKNSEFLPDDFRNFFEMIAKVYDRVHIKNEVAVDQAKTFVKNVLNGAIKDEETRRTLEPHMEKLAEIELPNYLPYIQRIDEEINQRGQYATNLFDAFFFDLNGVGKRYKGMYSEEEFKQKFGNLDKEKIEGLIEKLKEVGFLKNNSDFSYDPQVELVKLLERKEPPQISTLIIAGGHIGRKGIESISRYGNDTITLDLSSSEAPDIVVDINDPDFLNLLAKYFNGKLSLIEDTSNESDAAIFKEETLRKLAELLKIGGRLILSTNKSKDIGYVSEKTADYLKSLNLIPVEIVEHPITKEKLIKGIFQKIDS